MDANDNARNQPSSCDVAEPFTVRLLPPVLVLTWASDLVVDRSDVLLAKDAIGSMGDGALPLLIELSRPLEITRDARDEILECRHSARIALLGSDVVDRVLTAFAENSPADIRFFTDRDEAELWLLQERTQCLQRG